MKITRIEDLHADAGWRTFSFLKISADNGLVGWSEYNESYGSLGLSAVIRALGESLIGEDPRPVERHAATLYARTRQAPGGLNAQAIAAMENALLDLKAKALGVPVYELFGGPVRERLRLYWSHCGTYLFDHADLIGVPALRTLDDVKDLGARVVERGFTALKCNMYRFDAVRPYVYMPGFGRGPGGPELNLSHATIHALRDQIEAFRDGTGHGADILVDLNFNFRTDGYMTLARALDDLALYWMEIDNYDPPRACPGPQGRVDADRVLRIPLRPAPVPSVPRQLRDGCRDHRRAVERLLRKPQDRGHVRRLRDQHRTAQFLRPPVDPDERALVRDRTELPHHGDRCR